MSVILTQAAVTGSVPRFDEKIESLTRHQTLSTVSLHLCSDGSSIRHSNVTLNSNILTQILYSTVTLTFDLLTPNCDAFTSVP